MFFNLPTKMYHEHNCVSAHADELCSLGTKALIITGQSSSKKNGSLEDVTAALDGHKIAYAIFDKIEENPSVETVIAAAIFGISEKADFVIGIGGGSPLDASKAVALLIANGVFDKDFLYTTNKNAPHLPVAAVPTTCGTGSEVTGVSVLTLHEDHTKKSIAHQIFPDIALVDSKYLKTAPKSVLISTALDALAHLCESYLHVKADAYSHMSAEKGLSVWGGVKQALLDGEFSDDTLDKLMAASVMAGISIRLTGTSLPHGLSYRVTYECKMVHGKACAVFLPAFIDNAPDEYKHRILELLGFERFSDLKRFVETLCADCEIPQDILELSIADMLKNKTKLASACYPIDENMLRKITEDYC
ncbi:iron-containing alcohol dehydrogenase family protein [Ruminococcus sp.]|uniref:iron-containing alcohol dehydrogenase family protein n=1 Tax=Ruminococcus sp. TaxID=41978 RepID=UPI0025F0CF5C|nr:iron-containing alcohol dehydrogenase family protein [Ruminococcus sp.]